MRVLLDECLPERLKDELPGHQVLTAREAGLAGKKNGLLPESEPWLDGHGPNQKHSLDKGASKLGREPGPPLGVKVCTAYASPAAKASFLDSIFAFLR